MGLKTGINWDRDAAHDSPSFKMHCRYIHDMLYLAERERMNVWMFLASIRREFWDHQAPSMGDIDLTGLIRNILGKKAEGKTQKEVQKVSIISWEETGGYAFSGLDRLRNETGTESLPGKLWVGQSNTRKHIDHLCPFVLCTNKTFGFWRIFYQDPLPDKNMVANGFIHKTRGYVVIGTGEAAVEGKKFLKYFGEIAQEIVRPAQRRTAAVAAL